MADAKMLKKVPVREQDPKVRATNFEEVCLGYNQEEAMEEAQRCLGCKKPKCVEGCPVSINIPGFIEEIKEGKIEEAYKVIGLSSALPAICGRVCPQESQCEGKCIRGVKGEAVSIGKLERFVADYALEHDIKPVGAEVKNGHKIERAIVIVVIPAVFMHPITVNRAILILALLEQAGIAISPRA